MEKTTVSAVNMFLFYLPGIIIFFIGTILDLGLIYLWCRWVDKIYTIKNSKNLYKISG